MKYPSSLKSLFSLSIKLLLIAILFFSGTYAFQILNNAHIFGKEVPVTVSADGSINVWWPTDSAKINNTQTFKTLVQDQNLSNYDMFWSVDNGQQNKMSDSQTDYPHKEAVVDVSGWNWHGTGPYTVTFSAIDHGGNSLGQTSVKISLPDAPSVSGSQVTVQAGAPNVATAISGIQSVQADVVTSTPSPSPSLSPTPSPSVSPSSAPVPATLNIWWPTDGATISGTQPFKAATDGVSSNYSMYWQVDGGQLNGMMDVATDGAHKESSVDVSGWNWKGTGPYTITFTTKDQYGTQVAQKSITIYTGSHSGVIASPTPSPVISQTTVVSKTIQLSNQISGATFYLDTNNDAAQYANSIRTGDPSDAAQMDKIGNTPTAVWLGNWNTDVGSYVSQTIAVAKKQGTTPVFVIYNIPSRDCGQYSSGGANNPDGYNSWIKQIANATGDTKAIYILEPDGTSLTDCLSGSQLSDRYSMLQNAITSLKSNSNTKVYIDAGHPNWISASDMASRLTKAGIAQADGFALNTSNFYTTQDNITYGTAISQQTGGKHFVIDTGRNGLGGTSDNQWCNPLGRALGSKPTTNTGNSLVDAFMWLKGPGGSDGNCNGGPSAGVFWPQYALDMAKRSAF